MPTRPRIVFVCEFPTALGGEHALCAILNELHHDRHEYMVLAPGQGPLAALVAQTGATLVPLPQDWRRGDGEARAARLARALSPLRPDLIHANALHTSSLLGGVAETLNAPCLGHARDIMRLSNAKAERLNRLPLILTASQATSDNLHRHGVAPDKTRVVYDGIDAMQTWNPERVEPGALRALLGLEADIPLVGVVGQLCLRKDQPTFLRAVASLSDSLPNLHAVVIGERYADSDEARALENECHELARPLGGRATLLGYRDNMPTLMRDLDVLVNCSRQEPCGRTILEAMALERAVVATDVGGSAEMIEENVSGRLVPPDDPDALAEAIHEILTSPGEAQCLGRAARARVLESFDIATTARQVAEVHDLLLQQRREP